MANVLWKEPSCGIVETIDMIQSDRVRVFAMGLGDVEVTFLQTPAPGRRIERGNRSRSGKGLMARVVSCEDRLM